MILIRKSFLLVPIVVALAACQSERSAFLDACEASGESRSFCRCTFDVAQEVLTDDEFETFMTLTTGTQAQAERALLGEGLLGGASLVLALVAVDEAVAQQCQV